MKQALRVLVIEDSRDDCDLILRELERGGYDISYLRVETADAMRAALREQTWDVVLSDFTLPTFSAPAALAVLKESGLDLPFIIVSGTVGEEIAVDALRAGAHDFMVKGRLVRLRPAIERELREVRARRQQRDAEAGQRGAEARFRAIMETATDAVVAADDDGTISYLNPAAEKMFGYAASELVGAPISRLMPERFRTLHEAGLARYTRTGEARIVGRTVEFSGLRKDGSEFPLDVSLGSWSTDGKKYFAAIIKDVSDRKKVEAQLIVADRLVAVGTLAAGVGHEINNPLAAVIANLDAAFRDLADLAHTIGSTFEISSLQQELADAREAAERIRHIVRDLRIFSRGEDEKRGPVDVERVMESTLRMAWNEIRHRARLVKNYGRVPLVEASEARLGQVFLNLLVNAAQAIAEGRAEQNEIRLCTRTEDSRVVIEISDTGPGIAPEVMSRLFTPFVTTKPVGVGTGLGLSICHRIVTESGGQISVESTLGKGTVFKIFLPCARSEIDIPKRSALSVGTARRRGQILVVDDEVMVARSIRRAIGPEHDVTAMERADEALERIVAGERFDVILCDLMMPEMTGMDLHARLLEVAPEQATATIFLTGGAFTPGAREFLSQTPNQRIEKPFDSLHLRALINDRIR